MKKRASILTAFLLLMSVWIYMSIVSNGNVRSVEFISIFAIGALSGVLLTQLFSRFIPGNGK